MPKVKTELHEKQQEEPLFEFSAVEQFSDGSLREFFEKLNYSVDWAQGEKRLLPKWLAQRCLNSGARLLTKDGRELSLE